MKDSRSDRSRLVNALEQLDVHDHLCLIYETQEEQFTTVVPFIRIGLERGEQCLYIADDNTVAAVFEAMCAEGVDVDAALKSGALTIVGKQEAYLKQGYFDPDWMIHFLTEAVDAAKAAGFSALRVTGEMTWALGGDPGVERLMEYQARLNHFFSDHDALAICQYNRRRFSPEVILDVIRTHPIAISGGMVCKNFYYVPPDEFLRPDQPALEVERLLSNIQVRKRAEEELREYREHLEELVDERTLELTATNQQLRQEIAERVRVGEALHRRDTILEAVSFAAERFLKVSDWGKSINEVLERLGQATQASRIYIFENHPDERDASSTGDAKRGTLLTSLRHEWAAPGIAPQIGNPKLQGLSWQTAGIGRWETTLARGDIIAGSVREFPASEQRFLAAQDVKSIIVVPIFVGWRGWWGFIGLDDCLAEREWSEGEIGALKAAAGILDAVIQRQRAEEALRQRNRELELINRTGQAFISTLDLDQVLVSVLEEVRHVLDVVACSAWLTDPETGELVCRQVTDPQSEIVRGWRLAPGQGIAGWVAQTGESLNVPDVRADERHFKGVDQKTGLPLRSILTVPLRVKERVIGVIQAVDAEVGRFTATDLTLVESLASAVAVAIENARLYEALKTSQEYVRNIIDSSLDMIITVDTDRRIVEFNTAAQKTFGYRPEEVVGKHIDMLYADPREALTIHESAVEQGQCVQEILNRRKNGETFPSLVSASLLRDARGDWVGVMGVSRDITRWVRAEAEREKLIAELQDALAQVKTLSGFLPICASCKKIRDDEGYWHQVEVYIRDHSEAEFSHGLCPDCAVKLYPDFFQGE